MPTGKSAAGGSGQAAPRPCQNASPGPAGLLSCRPAEAPKVPAVLLLLPTAEDGTCPSARQVSLKVAQGHLLSGI